MRLLALLALCLGALGWSLAFAVDTKTTNGPGGWTRDGNVVSIQNPATDVVIFPNFTGAGTLDAATLEGEAGSFYQDRTNHTGFQIASTISDFGGAVLLETWNSGIESHTPGDDTPTKVTFSAVTSNLVDIAAGDCHVQGTEFDFPAQPGVDPGFGAGENSSWFGCSATGLVKQSGKFTDVQKRTIMPMARIQAEGSCTGPGCPVSRLGILDHRYLIHEDGYRWEKYLSGAVGALFQTGGLITENGVTPLDLDISTGKMWDSDRTLQSWGSFTNISGLHKFHNSTSLVIQDATFSMDNVNWDNGENLIPMTNNNYHCSHSILMSPRGTQDADFDNLRVWWVHCTSEHSDLQGAIDSGIDYGDFVDQDTSGLVPLAQVIVKKNGANIVTIIDARPRIGAAGGAITSGSITLQGAYNNSSPGASEIVLNAAQDGFTISDNATPVGDLFKVNNFANTTSFVKVDPSGVMAPTLIGGAGSGDDLTLQSSSHATKGSILFGNSAYDEVNNRLGVGLVAPLLDVHAQNNFNGTMGMFLENTDTNSSARARLLLGDNLVNRYALMNYKPDDGSFALRLNGSGFVPSNGDLSFYIGNDVGDILFRSGATAATRMTNHADGRTSVGNVVSALGQLHADQASTTDAIPVLVLDQGDIDDTFINVIGTSAADGSRSISSDTTEDSAKFGAFRIEINGVTKWIRIYDNES